MADSTSSVSGLISGIDYRSLIDQIIAAEGKPATQARSAVDSIKAQQTAIATYRGLLDALRTAAKGMRDGTSFDAMSASAAAIVGTKPIVSASASPTAAAASYNVSVTSLAKAQKLGSVPQVNTATPVGVTGTFTVNGQAVTVNATDTLLDVRDKINALNQGTGPTRVSASILSVSGSSQRLVLTSETLGAAGATLADTSGNVLQTLGFLSDATTVDTGAVLQAGTDANFSIDGVNFTRTSNVISDAVAGLTFTLTGEDPTAVTQIKVERFTEGARTAVKGFIDAYNKLTAFIKTQGTAAAEGAANPALYNDTLIRAMRSSLPRTLLAAVPGAAADLLTPGMAGLTLDKSGVLSLDETKFNNAFENRLPDLRKLLQQTGTTTGTGLSYVASTTSTKAGTGAVTVTQLATRSSVTGAGLAGGVYGGAGDTMTVTDTRLGKSATINLTNGMTSTQIRDALTTAFGTNGLGLTVTDVGGQLQIEQAGFGSSAGITVAYGAGAGGEPVAAGTYANGLDIAGTIGGLAATGAGQVLVGAAGSDYAGLSVRYDGAATGAVGDVTVNLGTGSEFERMLDAMVEANTGTLAKRDTAASASILRLQERADRLDARLEVRRESLLKQFARMEVSIASFQNQAKSVTAILGALTTGANS
jgi:flagellar hook-associated protein 2